MTISAAIRGNVVTDLVPLWATDIGRASPYTLVAFGAYLVGVLLLGTLAHHLLKRETFLKDYFLGDRQLGPWVLALTYVATSVSAGSFVGFPALIYQNGWIMALWIGGYMISGLTTKGILAKRLNQVSRLSGAITVPDVLRDRFRSPLLGLSAGVLLVLFLVCNLVAQFKAGGLIMRRASQGVAETRVYQAARDATANTLKSLNVWNREEAATRGEGAFNNKQYPDYVLGILIFAVTVVAYTTYGGFWAVTWTDVLQGLVIVGGALLLMTFALIKVGGLTAATTKLREIDPNLVTGPGPKQFLPLALAATIFFQWTIAPMGHPVGMVRLMACPDTKTMRRALFLITIFYALIYLPLVIAFVCGRALYPTAFGQGNGDDAMPGIALAVTEDYPLLGGLILAAPYAAAMSAVAGFLLLMSSSLVRDIYQRNINPDVSPKLLKRISYLTTAVVGIIVTIAALRPADFLQYIIVFTGTGMGATFLAPTVMALYWRRSTRAGALAAMYGGFLSVMGLYVLGWCGVRVSQTVNAGTGFAPLYLFDVDPFIYGLVVSFGLGIGVSLGTAPPEREEVDRYFMEASPNGVPPSRLESPSDEIITKETNIRP
jgi:SSS family solute:Na+ symporter/sodium/pantothenate symporter